MKALVGTFNQEKALVGAFFVIVQLRRLIVCSSSGYAVPAPVVVLLVVQLPALRAVARAPRPLQRRQVREIKAAAGLQT